MKKETLCIPESGIMSSKPPSRESRFASTTPRADRSVKSTPWRPLLEPHFGGVRVSKWNARLEKPKSRLKTAWLDRIAYSDEGDQDSELIVISVPGLM